MKILVVSDSHGDRESLLRAVSLEAPDLILHLGDHYSDCVPVREAFPGIPLRAVRGNCDRPGGEADWDEFVAEGKRIFMTHGHLYGVKYKLDDIVNNAMLRGADILLFGHTHRAMLDEIDGLYVMNPGSVGASEHTFGTIMLTDGAIHCELKFLNRI
jgi:putative phosphoesterase